MASTEYETAMEQMAGELSIVRTRIVEIRQELAQLEDREAALVQLLGKKGDPAVADPSAPEAENNCLAVSNQIDGERESAIDADPEIIAEIRHLIGQTVKDQSACRESQKALDIIFARTPTLVVTSSITPAAREAMEKAQKLKRKVVVSEVASDIARLACDPFGNYFIQKLFVVASGDELLRFIEALGTALPEVCGNMHGTRSIQKLVDVSSTDSQYELLCELIANELVTMVCDLNANHVILKILTNPRCPDKEKGNMYQILTAHSVEVSMNKQGCCVIQRCVDIAPECYRTEILNTLIANALTLVHDSFGNYVIQYILDLQSDAQPTPQTTTPFTYANRIIRQLLHHIATLSCNKFSSNVVEKCLRCASGEVRQLLLDEITDPTTLPKLLTQSYANYVVQTAIAVADDQQFVQLRDAILPLQGLLKNTPYGVKIASKLQRRIRSVAARGRKQIEEESTGASAAIPGEASSAPSDLGGSQLLGMPRAPFGRSQRNSGVTVTAGYPPPLPQPVPGWNPAATGAQNPPAAPFFVPTNPAYIQQLLITQQQQQPGFHDPAFSPWAAGRGAPPARSPAAPPAPLQPQQHNPYFVPPPLATGTPQRRPLPAATLSLQDPTPPFK